VLTLDRTTYGGHYGSGKLFGYLGQNVVNHNIHLHVKIHGSGRLRSNCRCGMEQGLR
jgi:hypothetical protein